MHIPLVYEHLFYKYFVRRSVGQATKGKRASILMDVVIFVTSTIAVDFFHVIFLDLLIQVTIKLDTDFLNFVSRLYGLCVITRKNGQN